MIRKFYSYNPITEILNIHKFEEYPGDDECTNVMNTIENLNFSRYEIQTAWVEYWGSFLSNLWQALVHADMDNAKIILEQFGHYVYQDYKNWLIKPIDEADMAERELAERDLLSEFIF